MSDKRLPQARSTPGPASGLPHRGRRVVWVAGPAALVAAALLVVLWAALGGGGDGGGAPATSEVDARLQTDAAASSRAADDPARTALAAKGQQLVVPVERREPAAPIQLRTASYADGRTFNLASERGNVVVLFFMAGWCFSCVPESRALAQIHEEYASRGVRILVLDVEQSEDERALARFREEAGNGRHLWALDRGFTVARAYDVRMLDTTIVIDREGRIAYTDGSPTPYEIIAAVIEALL